MQKPKRPQLITKREIFPFIDWAKLFSADHHKKIKSAVWEFGSLFGKVTKEVEYKGKVYGLVSGGKDIAIKFLAKELGRSIRDTKRNLTILKDEGYILVRRTRYGGIYVFPNFNRMLLLLLERWRGIGKITFENEEWPKYVGILEKVINRSLSKRDLKRIKTMRKKKRKSKSNYIYLIGSANYYKIGITKNVKNRIRSHQTSNPLKIDLILKEEVNHPLKIERQLHKRFNSKSCGNEWFRLSKKDVEEVREIISTHKTKVTR